MACCHAMSENQHSPPSGTLLAVERHFSIWNFIFGLLSIVIAVKLAVLLGSPGIS
jgi:hypothetical protein